MADTHRPPVISTVPKSSGAGRKKNPKKSEFEKMMLTIPADVAAYIRENGHSGFVIGLVRGVMPRG